MGGDFYRNLDNHLFVTCNNEFWGKLFRVKSERKITYFWIFKFEHVEIGNLEFEIRK